MCSHTAALSLALVLAQFQLSSCWSVSFTKILRVPGKSAPLTREHSRESASRFNVLYSSMEGEEMPFSNPTMGEDGETMAATGIEDAISEQIASDEEIEALLGDWDERVAQYNALHLVGRVGNNPEPRYFDDGNVVVNLNLACERNFNYAENQAGEDFQAEDEKGIRGQPTDWYGLEIWGSTAEFTAKYVDKGARIGVIGSLQVDEWNDKETGEKRKRAKCIVRELDILETRAEGDARRSNSRGPSFYTGGDDDDIYDPSRGSAGGFFG